MLILKLYDIKIISLFVLYYIVKQMQKLNLTIGSKNKKQKLEATKKLFQGYQFWTVYDLSTYLHVYHGRVQVYLSICLFILAVYKSNYLSTCLSWPYTDLSIYLPIYHGRKQIYLSIYLFIMAVYRSIYLSTCSIMAVYRSIYLSTCLSWPCTE